MILNLLNLYTLIFALFGKVNAMTSRLAVMKSNISQQGLNLADLLEHATASSLLTPIFNGTSETNAYYDVSEPTLFILNATETPVNMEMYATSTEPVTEEDGVSLTGTCFQIMVDCSTLEITTEASTTSSTISTTTTFVSEEDELIYDDEGDYETVPQRLKRQVLELLDQQAETTTGNPSSKSTPQSIGRLLDSLNSILRNLKRNTTVRIPYTTLPYSTSTEQVPTTTPHRVDASTPELLDNLIRWHTAGLILTTEEDEAEDNSSIVSNIYDPIIFNQTDPPDEFNATDNDTTTTQHPVVSVSSESTVRTMCPLVVCPWNDTVGYFSSLTTNVPGEEDDNNSSSTNGVPCRGDNPQGCTPFWTSSRDETITSFHSSVHFSNSTQPNGKLILFIRNVELFKRIHQLVMRTDFNWFKL